jgi:hypothetical protein
MAGLNQRRKNLMKLIQKSLSICLIMAICLTGWPAARADARASAGETGTREWTAPQPPGVTSADWEQIQALLPTDVTAQQAYLKASNTGEADMFGLTVAISGDTIVVGAPYESSNATGVNGDQSNDLATYAGAAYVFIRDGTTWSQQAYLKASNTDAGVVLFGDQFGGSVAISGDTIVVGAGNEDSNATGVNGNQSDNSAFQAGAAYVFTRSGNTWSQQAYLKASNTGAGDAFGGSVAISGDTIVIGALESSNATGVNGDQSNDLAPYSGAAYVFVRDGTTWSQQAYLKASNTEVEDQFGRFVAISGDTIVVGAQFEDSNATGVDGDQSDNSANRAGAAYVFTRSGNIWSQQTYLKASNTDAEDHFGGPIAIFGDTIVVGVPDEDSNATGVDGDQSNNSLNAGAAYVFTRDGVTWSQQAYLKASNTDAEDYFGHSVAITGDTIVVGADQEDSNATGVNGDQSNNSLNAGAAYVFTRDGVTWSQQAYLKASNTDAEDYFGHSVAITGDTIVVGADQEGSNATGVNGDQSDNSAPSSGAVYVFFTPPVKVIIGGIERGAYALNPSESTRQNYGGVNDGPVKIIDNSDTSLIAAQRLIYKFNGVNTSFMEKMGLPNGLLDTTYWLPWYNNLGLNSQLRFANVSDTTTSVSVSIGGVPMEGSPFILEPDKITRVSFAGIDDGPVRIESDVPIIAAERVIYNVKGIQTSFSEMVAFPSSQLDTTYWLPWYNNLGLDSQLRLANVSNAAATVHVFIAGEEAERSPFTLQPGESTRQSFAGIDDGPVRIESDVPIVAAERVIYRVNGSFTSYTEMMALPDGQLDTTFWFPWYNNLGLDSQLRFANVSNAVATVHIFIRGEEVDGSPVTLQVGEGFRRSFPGIDDGPVKVESDVPIVASQRVVYKVNGAFTSFTEMMGLPESQLDTTYWFPWYNNTGLDAQLRFGRP